MRKVKCYECGKIYNFDIDDFCPKCGAFNQPRQTMRIGADGSVIRNDGLNESNHEGSFVHSELHEENKERKRKGLDKDLVRTKTIKINPSLAKSKPKKKPVGAAGVIGVAGWVVLIFFLRIVMAILD